MAHSTFSILTNRKDTPLDEFSSTPEQMRDFLLGNIWADLTKEINAWLNDIRDQLENVTDKEEISNLQGSAKACRNFLNLPMNIIEIMLERIDDGRTN